MLVASHVPALLRRPLLTALRPNHRLAEAADWIKLAELVRRRTVDVLVVDPAAEGEVDVRAVAALLEQFPKIPLLVYTVMGPGTCGAVAELSRRGLQEAVFYGYDDAPARLRFVIDQVARRQLGCHIAASISERLDTNARDISRAIGYLFERPQDFSSIEDVAIAAHVPRWRLYQVLQGSGFKAPRRIFVAARVLRAYMHLRDPMSTVYEVATMLGYTDLETFSRHTHAAFGMQPRQLRKRMSEEEVTERLMTWIYSED